MTGNRALFSEKYPLAGFFLSMDLNAQKKTPPLLPDVEAIKERIAQWDLETVNVLVLYGIEQGYGYRFLKTWLHEKEERYLVLLEDRAEAMQAFLETAIAKECLLDRCVEMSYFDNPDTLIPLFWKFVFLKVRIEALSDPSSQLQKLREVERGVHLVASAYSDFGLGVFKNFYHNVHLEARPARALFDAFAHVPAVICGAGPSLEKNREILKELSTKALIFSGGSALGMLGQQGIDIHFGASLDPDPPPERFLKQGCIEAPFFFQHSLSSTLLRKVQGPRLFLEESGLHPLYRWIFNTLRLPYVAFDAGWNVVNFLSAIAVHMGCDPVILVGTDLAYANGRAYASDVEQVGEVKQESVEKIPCVDAKGNPLFSKNDWLMGAKWLEELAESYPDCHFINATEGGLALQGFEHLSLREVADRSLVKEWDLKGKIHQLLLQIPRLSLIGGEGLTKLKESFLRSRGYCEVLSVRKDLVCELELEEEVVYLYLLEPMWQVWKYPLLRREGDPFRHKIAFFMRVIQSYLEVMEEWDARLL